MDIEAKERSEPNALIRSALSLLRLFLIITATMFFCPFVVKIKKRSAVRSALDIKPDVGQALPSSAIR